MVCLRRHFVPNPVQVNYCTRRLAKRRRPQLIHTGYDADGNRIEQTTISNGGVFGAYSWNNDNQLTGVGSSLAHGYLSYAYDAFGRMVSRHYWDGTTQNYIYLCPGQVAGGGFVRPVCRWASQGTGQFNFAHRSMAA